MDNDILDMIVFETKWSWHDVLMILEQMGKNDLVDAFKATIRSEQERIVREFSYYIGKGLEAGIMSEWTVAMDTAIDCSGLIGELEDLKINIDDHNYRIEGVNNND